MSLQELAITAVAFWALVQLAVGVLQWRTQRNFLVVVTKQSKMLNQEAKAARKDASDAVKVAQDLLEETRLMHVRADRLMADPRLKRLLSKE